MYLQCESVGQTTCVSRRSNATAFYVLDLSQFGIKTCMLDQAECSYNSAAAIRKEDNSKQKEIIERSRLPSQQGVYAIIL